MKFKVKMDDQEMTVELTEKGCNVEFFKDGKSTKKYENLPVEMLSTDTPPDEDPKDKKEKSKKTDPESEPEEQEGEEDIEDDDVEPVGDEDYELDALIEAIAEGIPNPRVKKRMMMIFAKHYTEFNDIFETAADITITDDYDDAIQLCRETSLNVSKLALVVAGDFGADTKAHESKSKSDSRTKRSTGSSTFKNPFQTNNKKKSSGNGTNMHRFPKRRWF